MSFRMFGEDELAALREVVESQEIWRGASGNYVARLEDAFAEHAGREYVHAVNSGTSANEAALAACGIGPGDEVICPPCSFIASSLAAVGLGAVPVFADVDPRNLIITADAVEAAVTPRAKAVVVVHLWGIPADMEPIMRVARKHDLKVVEDCAQAYDAYYRGQMVGTFGDATCYSLQQSKHMTAGEGGLVTTDDPDGYARAVLYSNCGMPWFRDKAAPPEATEIGGIPQRGHFAFGHNYRMSELQGAVAFVQLRKIERFNARRAEIAAVIEEELRSVPGLRLAHTPPDSRPNYWAYPLWLDPEQTTLTTADLDFGRYNEINYLEDVFQRMERERRTSVGYPLPEYVSYAPGTCPSAEAGARRLFTLWPHPLAVDPEQMRAKARDIAAKMHEAMKEDG
ncbi:MAG: DegT/DnrJ/EryC1/StrS family aminotransferase [Armatimonadota bacterium]|nr:MAG: DegT/DnrJ/EryC1/StrS family aminotransferase [Armatimonadota bacterium]